MTAGFGPHLTPDEFDAWLAAGLDSDRARHLELCLECQARADAERALDEQLAALQLLSPAPDLADRVMRHVAVPAPDHDSFDAAGPSPLPGDPPLGGPRGLHRGAAGGVDGRRAPSGLWDTRPRWFRSADGC